MSKSAPSQSQTSSQVTTQIDKRIGASDSAVVLQGGGTAIGAGGSNIQAQGDLTIENLDAEVIAQSLGLSREVAEQLANFAIETSKDSTSLSRTALIEGFDFGRDVSGGANETVQKSLDALSRSNTESLLLSDRTTSQVAQSFETFGTELSKVKEAQVTGNESLRAKTNQTLIIAGSVASVVLAGVYLYSQMKKRG